jgi:lipopolysaccharide transport system permease protein
MTAADASASPHGVPHPFAFLTVAHRHRRLILRLAARRIEAQYRGSALGMLWAVLQPLLLLAVYTFAFSVVLGSRWDAASDRRADFALFAYSGMLLFGIFARPFAEAPSLIVSNQAYIKQLVFPAEVLAWVSVLTALFDFAVGLALWSALFVVVRGVPPATWALLPALVVPLVLLALAASWLLSSLGVFLRDLSQLVGLAATGLFFLSPIVYPASRIPESLAPWYALNPLVGILEASKELLFLGGAPAWSGIGAVTLAAWIAAWLCHLWFLRTKGSFADVL